MFSKIKKIEGITTIKKEQQKGIIGGRQEAVISGGGLDIYCHCSEGGGWHVGTASTPAEIMSLSDECTADGGTPSTYKP